MGIRKANRIENCGNYIKVFYFNKKHGYFTIDAEDYILIKEFCWCNDGAEYPIANSRGMGSDLSSGKRTTVKAHRLIMGFPKDKEIDHDDGDPSNNRKYNLRICTHKKNLKNQKMDKKNTSGYVGVGLTRNNKAWRSRIFSDGKEYMLGIYTTKKEAAYAYDYASSLLHKSWGKTNSDLGLLDHKTLDKTIRDNIESKVRTKLELKGVII